MGCPTIIDRCTFPYLSSYFNMYLSKTVTMIHLETFIQLISYLQNNYLKQVISSLATLSSHVY